MMDYLLSGIVTFAAVFLKGFQHKNVIKGKYQLTFVTSYLMAVCDVVSIGLIVKNGWIVAIPCGTGAAFGMIASMYLHDKFVK